MYLNRLTLIGFVGADAEIKTGNNESQFAGVLSRDQTLVEDRQRRMGVPH